MHPSLSNVCAFAIAFVVSFIGHFHWTFSVPGDSTPRPWGRPLLKFTVVALFGFLLNALAVYVVTDAAQISYLYATIFMVTVTPLSVFVLGKFWAFS
jgi:putative flippase GtrA